MNVPVTSRTDARRRSSTLSATAGLLALALLVTTVAAAQTYAPPLPAPPYTSPPSAPTYAPAPSGAYGTAPANPQEVSRFVRSITGSTRFERNSVVRWRAPLCFDVQGLPENEAEFVRQRLAQIASNAGAEVHSRGCGNGSYNFHVVFTLNSEQVAHDWYKRHRDLFDSNASRAQINRFLDPQEPGPVRVWHSGTLFGRDGFPLIPVDPGSPVEPMPYLNSQYDGGSRLTSEAFVGLNWALVIIDGRLANGAALASLTDYAAMVGLADLDLKANVGDAPTILRLFSAPPQERPSGLSSWDEAFLNALYHSGESARNLRAQITGTMVRAISPQ